MANRYENAPQVALQNAQERGDMFKAFELAREGLAVEPDNAEFRYALALALARLGEPEAALRSYDRNRVADIGTEDAIALKARLLKDMALRAPPAEQPALFQLASQAYQMASQGGGGGYFSLINEATTAFLAGDRDRAGQLAKNVAQHPEVRAGERYFAAATLGEAHLLCGEITKAVEAFKTARLLPDANPGAMASATRQAAIILSRLNLGNDVHEAIMEAVRPEPVMYYCGHMLASGWPGLGELEQKIALTIAEFGSTIAVGSLACGADILVTEAVLAKGGEVHLVLPFLEGDFIRTSVSVGGNEWVPRFERVRQSASSITFATQMPFVNDDNQYAYCSKLAMGMARLRADTLQTYAFQLALWDGEPANSIAGTAADIEEWHRQKATARIIPVEIDRPHLVHHRSEQSNGKFTRALQAILFADFSGFSNLSEQLLPGFLNFVMGAIGSIFDSHGDAVLCRNSWGDAIYGIVATPRDAALIALEIQAALTPALLQDAGLPDDGGMRISLHCGPIYEDYDPVRRAPTYYGTEVTLAARIEPRVPVGSIYTTQQFAALLSTQEDDPFHFEYVGKMELAKNYGARILYRLTRANSLPGLAPEIEKSSLQ